jgi:ABC-type methionine transport system permease subunit
MSHTTAVQNFSDVITAPVMLMAGVGALCCSVGGGGGGDYPVTANFKKFKNNF